MFELFCVGLFSPSHKDRNAIYINSQLYSNQPGLKPGALWSVCHFKRILKYLFLMHLFFSKPVSVTASLSFVCFKQRFITIESRNRFNAWPLGDDATNQTETGKQRKCLKNVTSYHRLICSSPLPELICCCQPGGISQEMWEGTEGLLILFRSAQIDTSGLEQSKTHSRQPV